jgi:hypothetical protein
VGDAEAQVLHGDLAASGGEAPGQQLPELRNSDAEKVFAGQELGGELGSGSALNAGEESCSPVFTSLLAAP